jgi:hypothetical protein
VAGLVLSPRLTPSYDDTTGPFALPTDLRGVSNCWHTSSDLERMPLLTVVESDAPTLSSTSHSSHSMTAEREYEI